MIDTESGRPPVLTSQATPRVSIVVPVRNEAPNIAPLLAEIERVCTPLEPYEVIYIDDGSTDSTAAELAKAKSERPWLRVLSHPQSAGKSAGLLSGIRVARAPVIATLDGDGENDPAYLIPLATAVEAGKGRVGLSIGQRVGRKSSAFKRWQSRIANKVRGTLLRDDTRDTGCGLKAFPREVFLRLPYFAGLHRFLPALVHREGYDLVHVDVVDRPRFAGVSNYGFFDRLWVGIADLLGVWWLIRRNGRRPPATET